MHTAAHRQGGGFYLPSDGMTRITLGRMRRIVAKAIRDPDFVFWARSIVGHAPPHDHRAKAIRIREYVRKAIRFTRDPAGIEDLTLPTEHMRRLQSVPAVGGDCDDAATLAAALGMAVGIPASFTVLGFFRPDAPFQHVFASLHPPGGMVDVDTTRNAQRLPPVATRRLTVRV